MAITRRTTSDPLSYIREDLLLNMQLLEIHLGACNGSLADAVKVEALVEVIEQIYNPLQTLERRDALVILDALRAVLQDGADRAVEKLALMRQAVQQLHCYMETCLSPGCRQDNGEALLETATALRQLCPAAGQIEAPGWSKLRELLGRLEDTLHTEVENAAEQGQSWQALEADLAQLQQLTIEQDWEQSAEILGRLQRIVRVLVAGAAADYGILVSAVCAETLASLRYALQSPEEHTPAVMEVLHRADQQLRKVDILLAASGNALSSAGNPTSSNHAPLAAARPQCAPSLPDFPELTFPAFIAPAALVPAQPSRNQEDLPTVVSFEVPDLAQRISTALLEPSASGQHHVTPHLEAESAMSDLSAAAPDLAQLIHLIGLDAADPEFAEVFLEEAQSALATIEQALALWRSDLTDKEALTTLRRAFHTLKGSGRMVGTMLIGDFAWVLESLLNQVLEEKVPASSEIADAVAAAAAALAPLVGNAPLRGAEVQRLSALAASTIALGERLELAAAETPDAAPAPDTALQLFAPESDAEFVEVFIEEAHGQLAFMHQQLELWRHNFEDRQAISALRRAFHTIKGSSSMVGMSQFGEAAWAC